MNLIYRYILSCFILLMFMVSAYANTPHIINISKDKYKADNKNWSIGQDDRGVMYFGNDVGLLEFDGVEWNLYHIPNSLTARSLAVLSHETIFTGSYEEFGRWDRDISGKLVYTSLSDKVDKALFGNDDFWKIWIAQDCVYFQSFNSIYVYDYETITQVPADHGFLFLTKVRDEFLVQRMVGPLYRLEGTTLHKLEGSEIFEDTDVRVILPYGEKDYLIGTSTKGIYLYDGKSFKVWNPSLSDIINSEELNCAILSSKGTYFLGTILGGIYEVDINGKIIDHISSEGTLQNNTVLSMYEDNLKNIWVGLDKGLSYIQYIDNTSCYTDPNGHTGAVYCGAVWNNKLFIGTNQGLFYMPEAELEGSNPLSRMKLVDGTQGQVWALKVVDGVLYCCHNKGLKEIHTNLSVTDTYNIGTGVYNLLQATIKGQKLLLLSTYSSVRIINTQTKKMHILGQISEPIINANFDHLGNLWLEHFNRGIYRCKLNDDFSGFRSFSYYGGNNNDGLPYKMKMFKVGGRIELLGDDKFYTYDDISDRIVSNTLLNECFKETTGLRQIIHIRDNDFWALTPMSVYKFSYDGYEASIFDSYNLGLNLSLVNTYENVSILNDSLSMICLDNGFLLNNKTKDRSETLVRNLYPPYIEALQISNIDRETRYIDMSGKAEIPYNFNTVTFNFFTKDAFALNLSFQYLLENVDKDWSQPNKINKVSYARLPKGEYVFKVRAIDDLGNVSDMVSYEFEIKAPWYLSVWAYLAYVFVIMGILYIIWLLILRRYRNLHLQKIRMRETRRLRDLAGELQQEVEQKNAELLTQTSFIIQKNELIFKIKAIIDDFYSKSKTSGLAVLYQKINALLNSNLDSEDDWKTFLIKFEEKHTGFFKKMKMLYPQLTNNDLRLCACLKLNLETKEIASLMNLSIRAVENSRYRLRKKLNLKPSQNLNEFFLGID